MPSLHASETSVEAEPAEQTTSPAEDVVSLVAEVLTSTLDHVTHDPNLEIMTKHLLEERLLSSLRRIDDDFGDLVISERMESSREALFKCLEAMQHLDEGTALGKNDVDTCLDMLLALGRLFDVVSAERVAATALRRAAKTGDIASICKLLDGDAAGVAIDKEDKWGHTALMEATEGGHASCVDELLKRGASVNAANKFGYTVLKFAAMKEENLPMLRLILAAQPDLDFQSPESLGTGNTALHNAAESGYSDVVKLLLEAGSDPDIKNAHGKTAMQLAYERHFDGTVSLFDTEASQRCRVQFHTDRASAEDVCVWLKHEGCSPTTVSSFGKAGIHGSQLLRFAHDDVCRLLPEEENETKHTWIKICALPCRNIPWSERPVGSACSWIAFFVLVMFVLWIGSEVCLIVGVSVLQSIDEVL